MPIGGCCWRPHSELPAGEIKGCTSESRREKLPHLLSACGGSIRQFATAAGVGKRLPTLQLPDPSMYGLVFNFF